jgi:hypothetical protein
VWRWVIQFDALPTPVFDALCTARWPGSGSTGVPDTPADEEQITATTCQSQSQEGPGDDLHVGYQRYYDDQSYPSPIKAYVSHMSFLSAFALLVCGNAAYQQSKI